MTESNQTDGEVLNYDDSLKTPIIEYNNSNNTIVFNNPIETNLGIIASSEDTPATFNSSVIVNGPLSVGLDFTNFVQMPLPSDPFSLNIPIINSMGTIQTTDLMIANNGVMNLYSNTDGTRIYGNLTVDGVINGYVNNIDKDMVGFKKC